MSPQTVEAFETWSAQPRCAILQKSQGCVNGKLETDSNFLKREGLLAILRRVPGGVREERLRSWVSKRLKRRGIPAALARHLGRPQSWVTRYSTGEGDADFDTAIAIAEFFRVKMAAIVGEIELPDDERPPAKPLSIEVATAAAALELVRDPLQHSLVASILSTVLAVAKQQPNPERVAELSRASLQEVTASQDKRRRL